MGGQLLRQGLVQQLNVTAYGWFTQGGFYADVLAGYAYFNNQLQRQILIPGLQPMHLQRQHRANQFLGQVETGYKIGIFRRWPDLTPFARLQLRP